MARYGWAPFFCGVGYTQRNLGNDTFDISVIVGAGGNMTIQQIGDPSTRKGNPHFMQELRDAWHKADAKTKADLAHVVHLDKAGDPIRIDAPKSNPKLEAFVRRCTHESACVAFEQS